jgi:nucleoside-diphosphate-sugar epimerase
MKKGYFPLPDSGTALVDFTAVENVNHAIWLIINANRAFQGDIYNITNNEPMQLSALLKLISKNFDVELKTISIPKPLLLSLARMVEGLTKLLGAGDLLYRLMVFIRLEQPKHSPSRKSKENLDTNP